MSDIKTVLEKCIADARAGLLVERPEYPENEIIIDSGGRLNIGSVLVVPKTNMDGFSTDAKQVIHCGAFSFFFYDGPR